MTKYYDDMGKDVTEYVQDLERKIMELQRTTVESKGILEINKEIAEKQPIESGTMDTEKPKTKRSKTYAEP